MKAALARLFFYCACALTAVYTLWILIFPVQPGIESAGSSVLIILFLFETILFGMLILRKPGFPISLNRSWVLIILAAFSQMLAEGLWFYDQTIRGIDPFPSAADFFYLSYYVLLFVAVLMLPFSPLKRSERTLMAMDLSIVMLAAILLMYYFVLAPIHTGVDGIWTLDLIVVSFYPCADLLILTASLSLLQRNVERISREIILVLCASLLFTFLADLSWIILGTYEVQYPGFVPDWLWTLAALALLTVAYRQFSQPVSQNLERPLDFQPLLRDLAPYFFTGAVLLLVLVSALKIETADQRFYSVVSGSIVLGALVMLRQYILLRENRRLYREMEHLATIDPLTGLNNRRSFEHAIEVESRRADRFGHPYAVLMMDVDKFKLYNDRFGHLGGDVVLKRMAELLAMNLRMTDFVARFGGDEFVAILPETDLENAKKVAAKIQDEAQKHFIRESIGISVGVAVWEPGMAYLEVVNAADQNLYKSKQLRQQ